MSNRQDVVIAIHPKALSALGLEVCLAALGVACDFRHAPVFYNQRDPSCCIAGHIAQRMGRTPAEILMLARPSVYDIGGGDEVAGLCDLFDGKHPSDPVLAADAIERYVRHGSDRPWTDS